MTEEPRGPLRDLRQQRLDAANSDEPVEKEVGFFGTAGLRAFEQEPGIGGERAIAGRALFPSLMKLGQRIGGGVEARAIKKDAAPLIARSRHPDHAQLVEKWARVRQRTAVARAECEHLRRRVVCDRLAEQRL